MRRTKSPSNDIADQIKKHAQSKSIESEETVFQGNFSTVISTGSTLLDLAISGEVTYGGGLPSGIFVEIFGPSGCGKTVMLCEIAGCVQRQGGDVKFFDPEARLNNTFAQMLSLDIENIQYSTPDTVPEVFNAARKFTPSNPDKINGIFADSLAALSTKMEMEGEDKMGQRRAKEFSEQLRKTCRIIKHNNYLMVCSNQVRDNIDAGMYEVRYTSTGGRAIGYYSSLRLRCQNPQKITKTKKINGQEFKRVIGVTTEVEVFKSTVGRPYRKAPLMIRFDYGIDDIGQNLQYVKDCTGAKVYSVDGESLGNSIDAATKTVEENKLKNKLRKEVITLWTEIESEFRQKRPGKYEEN